MIFMHYAILSTCDFTNSCFYLSLYLLVGEDNLGSEDLDYRKSFKRS